MKSTTATITTDKAQRIMKRLSKHWAHKLDVQLEENSSFITLPMGTCQLNVQADALVVEVEAPTDGDMQTTQQVVADHLVRMANPDKITVTWV